MKKIFTLLLTVGSLTAAVAQSHGGSYGRTDSRIDDRRYDPSYSFNARERDEQIAQINRLFEAQIRDVKFDRHLSQNKKRKQIKKLELQRSQQITAVNARFADRRNRYGGSYVYGKR